MEIEFDPAKRDLTLSERGLDFRDAPLVFEGQFKTAPARRDHEENRFVTYGWLHDEAVAIVWTEREPKRRIISMRRMHAKEVEYVGLDRP